MIRRLLSCQALKAASILNSSSTSSSSVVLSYSPKGLSESFIPKRTMGSGNTRDLFYADIVNLSGKKEIILIDVREPAEIQETGKLPGSTHIPLGDVPNALSMDDAAFLAKYGIEKPDPEAPLVFSCRSGKRSLTALDKALAMGFPKSRHYAGGWLDWEKNTKQ